MYMFVAQRLRGDRYIYPGDRYILRGDRYFTVSVVVCCVQRFAQTYLSHRPELIGKLFVLVPIG